MTHTVFGRLALSVLFLMAIPAVAFAQSQTTASWFDINPSQSNTDNDNPNGASGGRVNRLGAASDFSKIYAATEWGGLYQSFDQGNTWIRINTFAPSASWDVKVDPRNSQRVYATSSFDGKVAPQSGISVSDTAGAAWTPVNILGLNTLTCSLPRALNEWAAWDISINSTSPATVFVGTSCGLARTLNTGATWDFVDPSPGDNAEQIFAVVAHGNQIVDVVGTNGHFRSINNGTTWSALPVGPGPIAGNSGPGITLAVSPAENYVLLAANTQRPPGVPAGINIWESVNGGTTWPTSLTPPTRGGNSVAQNRIPFVRTNQLSSSTQFDVWFGDVNVFKTTAITPSTAAPGGAQRTPQNSWTNMQGEAHWDSGDVLFDPRFRSGACPSVFAGDGGVYRNTSTINPGCQTPSWDQPTITPHATWLFGFDGIRLLPGIHAISYGLQDNGGYAATLVAEGHNPPTPNWNNYTCCDVLHNSYGAGRLLSLQGSSPPPARAFSLFIRNQDGSGGNDIPNYPTNATFSRFESGKQNVPFGATGYAVNLSDGVYFTNNVLSNPIAWTSLNSPLAATSGTGHLKIANVQGFPNVFYHTQNGNPEAAGLIFRSTLIGGITAPGTNWVPMPLPRGVGSATVYDVDPTNGNRAIISGINTRSNTFEIWMTPDFGANWNRVLNLETAMLGITAAGSTFVNRTTQGRNTGTMNFGSYWQPSLFKFNPLDPTTIVAGAVDAGVFLSLDNGNNWQRISNPINPTSASPHVPRPLFAYFSPGRFAASTNSFDVWVGTRGAGVMKVVLERRP